MEFQKILERAAQRMPGQLDTLLSYADSIIPENVDVLSVLKLIAVFAAVAIVLGLLGRIAFGKGSSLNSAVSCAISILFLYVLMVVVYTFKPWNLDAFLSPLPFVTFADNYLILLPFRGTTIPMLCSRLLSVIILAFWANLADSLMPKGKTVLGWYVLRLLTVALYFTLNFAVNWAINTYLPNGLLTYAPIILLGILAVMLLVSLANVVLGALLIAVNPVVGAIYAFFFSNKIGRQISKSVLTAAILCAFFALLEHFQYSAILVSFAALPAYLPMIVSLLLLWYLVGHTL